MSPTDRDLARLPRIIVVDDDYVLRRRLVQVLLAGGDLEIVGEAGTLAEGEALLDRSPQLVLLDLGLPDGNGVTIIQSIARRQLACKVLVLSVFEDRTSVVRTVQAGADGYLLKDTPDEKVLSYVRETLAGEAPISARAAAHLLSFVRTESRQQEGPTPGAPVLSPREKELLEHLARGKARKEAAREMGISHFTVGEYLQSLYRKLSVNSRGEAVYQAVQARLIHLDRDTD